MKSSENRIHIGHLYFVTVDGNAVSMRAPGFWYEQRIFPTALDAEEVYRSLPVICKVWARGKVSASESY